MGPIDSHSWFPAVRKYICTYVYISVQRARTHVRVLVCMHTYDVAAFNVCNVAA